MHALSGVGHYILHLQRGVGGQDYISQQAIVLKPRVLGDNAFYLRASEGFYRLVAMVPAGSPAGCISPYHVDFGAALFPGNGIGVFYELVFNWCQDATAAGKINGGL